jgi:uncharacterized protein YcbK (DUF882 family)
MAIIKFKKGDNKQLSTNFNSSEFECKCKHCDNDFQYIDEDLIARLQRVRTAYKKGIDINSGYRCPQHNEDVGGKPGSAHMSGLGADPAPALKILDELDELYELCYDEFNNIGDGRNKGFVHVDTRPLKSDGKKRTWMY